MKAKIPKHIAIIMDGNRRWAKKRGQPLLSGHQQGSEILKKIGNHCLKRGVKILTVYAFSTENWNRSKNEVAYLLDLLRKFLREDIEELHKKNIQLRFIGRIKELSRDVQELIEEAVQLTKNNTRGILSIALNYGGRFEIIDAFKNIIKKKIPLEKFTEKVVSDNLYTSGLPDPDLIIRTSGEQRLSNFLTWQSAYSEFYFVKKHWPEFSEKDLDGAIDEYSKRTRRFGK
jgi:undecaprenyl diphosphate synthase